MCAHLKRETKDVLEIVTVVSKERQEPALPARGPKSTQRICGRGRVNRHVTQTRVQAKPKTGPEAEAGGGWSHRDGLKLARSSRVGVCFNIFL